MSIEYSVDSAEHSLVLRSPYCLDCGFYTNRSLFLQSIDIYIYVLL